ncbi:MAG: ribonuclease P protein component [Candidatus Dadabacteria bacterium]|nr:ribonuclease P protein component [Candidatus Dadabacteria bacterium]NIQ17049.1 ribonuclease P protein component [Candidatus Dadabacteria bacterium]
MEKVNIPVNNSLPKKLRILKSESFQEIFKKGKKVSTKNFAFYILLNNLGFPRLGISVGKKVSNKANKRNRIKRLIRESFRANKYLFKSNDIVVIVKNDISELKQHDIFNEIEKAVVKF